MKRITAKELIGWITTLVVWTVLGWLMLRF